jgi:hypothetical protein
MKVNGVIWLRNTVDKLAWKHAVTTDEVEEIFNHAPRFRFIKKLVMWKAKICTPHLVRQKLAVI